MTGQGSAGRERRGSRSDRIACWCSATVRIAPFSPSRLAKEVRPVCEDEAVTSLSARIAVIGGSGLYRLFDSDASTAHDIRTPYGPVTVTVGELGGRQVASSPDTEHPIRSPLI